MPRSRAHDSSCRSSHLSPRLNLKDLLHPYFFLFCVTFAYPNSLFPGLGGCCIVDSSPSTSRPNASMKRDNVLSFTRCCRHLPPQFESFCGSHLHCMRSPRHGTIPFLNLLTPTFISSSGRLYSFESHLALRLVKCVTAQPSKLTHVCAKREAGAAHSTPDPCRHQKRCRAIGLSCLPNVVSHTAHMISLGWRWLHSTLSMFPKKLGTHYFWLLLHKGVLPTQRIVARRNLDACAHSLYHSLPARSLACGHLCVQVP